MIFGPVEAILVLLLWHIMHAGYLKVYRCVVPIACRWLGWLWCSGLAALESFCKRAVLLTAFRWAEVALPLVRRRNQPHSFDSACKGGRRCISSIVEGSIRAEVNLDRISSPFDAAVSPTYIISLMLCTILQRASMRVQRVEELPLQAKPETSTGIRRIA